MKYPAIFIILIFFIFLTLLSNCQSIESFQTNDLEIKTQLNQLYIDLNDINSTYSNYFTIIDNFKKMKLYKLHINQLKYHELLTKDIIDIKESEVNADLLTIFTSKYENKKMRIDEMFTDIQDLISKIKRNESYKKNTRRLLFSLLFISFFYFMKSENELIMNQKLRNSSFISSQDFQTPYTLQQILSFVFDDLNINVLDEIKKEINEFFEELEDQSDNENNYIFEDYKEKSYKIQLEYLQHSLEFYQNTSDESDINNYFGKDDISLSIILIIGCIHFCSEFKKYIGRKLGKTIVDIDENIRSVQSTKELYSSIYDNYYSVYE